jgi:ribosomal protein S18 acetylase RimI-like enzyme
MNPVPDTRYMTPADLGAVLLIDSESFIDRWDQRDFRSRLVQRDVIGQVFLLDQEIIGYLVYKVYRRRIAILRMAVDWDRRRMGIGTAAIGKLIHKLAPRERGEILIELDERNLAGLLFLRKLGFRAIQLSRGGGGDADAIIMRFLLPHPETGAAVRTEDQAWVSQLL